MTDRLTENMTERLVIAAYAASTDAAYTIGTELTKYLQTGTRGKEEEEEKKKEKKRHRECEEKRRSHGWPVQVVCQPCTKSPRSELGDGGRAGR